MGINISADISKMSWIYVVAIAGTVVSIFSIIYDGTYFLLGAVTFLYGIIAHWIDKVFWEVIVKEEKQNSQQHPAIYIIHSILMVAWIIILIIIYRFIF